MGIREVTTLDTNSNIREVPVSKSPSVREVPIDTPELTAAPATRPSDPFKQFLAGITDIGTGAPALAGFATAGVNALYDELFADGPQDLTENFQREASEGFAGGALNLAGGLRSDINEFFDIADPVSTEDQIARSLGSFIPIPGLGLVAGGSKLANAARTGFNIATPAVRTGKGFGKRAIAQAGIGQGIDQGIRAAIGEPLLLSDEAIHGTPTDPKASAADTMQNSNPNVETEPVSNKTGNVVEVDPETDVPFNETRARVDKMVQEEEEKGLNTWHLLAIAAGGSYGAAKFAQHMTKVNAARTGSFGAESADVGPLGEFAGKIDPARLLTEPVQYQREFLGVLNDGRKGVSQYIKKNIVDRSHALAHPLQAMGHSKSIIDKVVNNSHIDVRGMAQNVLELGTFGQGFKRTTHALRDLDVEIAGLGEARAKIFNQASVAQTELVSGIQAGRSRKFLDSSQNKGSTRSTADQKALIKLGRDDKEISKLMDKFSDVYDTHLDYLVHRKYISSEEAARFRSNSSINGKLAHMPLYATKETQFLRNLARFVGVKTTRGKELTVINEFKKRGQDGIDRPMTPSEALRQYTIHTIDAANTNGYQRQALELLSRVRLGGEAGHQRFFLDKDGTRIFANNSQVSYVGRAPIDDVGDYGKVTLAGSQHVGLKKGVQFGDDTIDQLKAKSQNPDDIMVVHHDGEAHIFHVPDAGVRAALDLNPQLGVGLHFMNHYKTLFTRFTTGNLSVFAPVSHAFSSQQILTNTIAKEGFGAGASSVIHGLKGTKEIFITNASKEVANYLAYRIATNTGIGRVAPKASQMLQSALERRFASSVLNNVRGETGKIASSLQASTFTGSAVDFADSIGPNFVKVFGPSEMGLVWRMWKTWNTAMHEGPAYGAMLRRIGKARNDGDKITPQLIRDAVAESKTVAGDMSRIGASGAAKAFNASIPFSAAMIQSWNTIGSAIKSNPIRFMAGASTVIGVPTVTELVYSATLSRMVGEDGQPLTFKDVNGRDWTYNDYYWNGFTTQQRSNNFIYFVPGEPPWEAFLMPVSPEWGVFRGATMSAMDAIFGFSQEGNIGDVQDQGGDSRDQLLASVARVLDIPLPPLVAAGFSKLGIDMRVGFDSHNSTDPDNPGPGIGFAQALPLPGGERVTGRGGQTRFTGGSIDVDTAAMIQDIFGSAGALYVAVHEAFAAGLNLDIDPEGVGLGGDLSTGLSNAMQAFGNGLQRQTRWTQPLFGKALRPNSNDEIAQDVFARKARLELLKKDFQLYQGDGVIDMNGRPIPGGTAIPPDDPINLELSADAANVEGMVAGFEDEIRQLRKDLTNLGNSPQFDSLRERDEKIDAIHLQISQFRALQLAEYLRYEQRASEILSKRYGRQVTIDLSTFTPRDNLPNTSISRELRK
jgi:hypothetical protein